MSPQKLLKHLFKTSPLLAIIFVTIIWITNIIQESSKLDDVSKIKASYPKVDVKLDQSFSGTAIAVDGDSIKVAGNSVRLLGIDAPEYKQTCFDAKNSEYPCGIISKNFTKNLVDGKNVTCHYHKKDIYNRYLAQCELDGVVINWQILRNGMAVIYNYSEVDVEIKMLESQAKADKLGIWQGSFQLPKEYRKTHKKGK